MILATITSEMFPGGPLQVTDPEVAQGLVNAAIKLAFETGKPMNLTVTTESIPDVQSFRDPNWQWKDVVASVQSGV